MEINFQNIEETFFLDLKIQELLPEFQQQFDSWRIAQMIPGLKPLSQKSVLEVLNNLNKSHLEKISKHFGQQVYVSRLNNKLTKHYNFTLNHHEDLCQYSEFREFCITANKDKIGVTFWR